MTLQATRFRFSAAPDRCRWATPDLTIDVLTLLQKEAAMMKFIGSGRAFLLLAVLFMVIGVISEKTTVYLSLGGLWLIVGLIMMAKNKQKSSVEKQDSTA